MDPLKGFHVLSRSRLLYYDLKTENQIVRPGYTYKTDEKVHGKFHIKSPRKRNAHFIIISVAHDITKKEKKNFNKYKPMTKVKRFFTDYRIRELLLAFFVSKRSYAINKKSIKHDLIQIFPSHSSFHAF